MDCSGYLKCKQRRNSLAYGNRESGKVGIKGDAVIVGNGKAKQHSRWFVRHRVIQRIPMLWAHDAQLEKRLVVVPDSEGRIAGRHERWPSPERFGKRGATRTTTGTFGSTRNPWLSPSQKAEPSEAGPGPMSNSKNVGTRLPTRYGVTARSGCCATGGILAANRQGAAACLLQPYDHADAGYHQADASAT